MPHSNLESEIAQDGLTAWLADPKRRSAVEAIIGAKIWRANLWRVKAETKQAPEPATPKERRPSFMDPGRAYVRFLPLMILPDFIGEDVQPCSRSELEAIFKLGEAYDDIDFDAAPSIASELLHNKSRSGRVSYKGYFRDEASWALAEDFEHNTEVRKLTRSELAALLWDLRRDIYADRRADLEWERKITPNENGRLEAPSGPRCDWMKSPPIPLGKAADMFEAALCNLTKKDLEPKNGNFLALVGTRRRNIFRKHNGVDWRTGPMQTAYQDIRHMVTATPGKGRYFSIAADIADPDGELRKTISAGLNGLDLAMNGFDENGRYPRLLEAETIAVLEALAKITRKIAGVSLTTASGVLYEVPPSFCRRTINLIEWFNGKFPWYCIHKHCKDCESLPEQWIGEFLTDGMARLYPDIDYDTIGKWIDLVLGAQNRLR